MSKLSVLPGIVPDSWGISQPPCPSRNAWLVPVFAHRRHWLGFCVQNAVQRGTRSPLFRSVAGITRAGSCAPPQWVWQDVPQANTRVTLHEPEVPGGCAECRRTSSYSLPPLLIHQNTLCRLNFLASGFPAGAAVTLCVHGAGCELRYSRQLGIG